MIAAFDLDRTLLVGNSSLFFCRYLQKRGLLSRFDLFYCSIIYFFHFFCGLSLWTMQSRVFDRLFKGKSVAELSVHLAPFLKTLVWYEPVLTRLKRLREEGYEICILSSSPRFLVEPIARMIDVTDVVATDYSVDSEGRLSAISLLIDGAKKKEALLTLGQEAIAFSDSHVDLPFLEAANQVVAVNPTRPLRRLAKQRNWEIL